MYGFINYIISMCSKYDNFFDYYIYEISHILLFYQFINSILLLFFFICLIINFFFKKYKIIFILSFLSKRFIFISFLFLFIYLCSDFTICDSPINKKIGYYLDTENKKYLAIACITITAGCLLYKYVPIWFTNLSNYNKNILQHKENEKILNEYNLSLQDYKIKKNIIIKKEKDLYDINYNNFIKEFDIYLQNLILLKNRFKIIDETYRNQFSKDFSMIVKMNKSILKFKKNIVSPTANDILGLPEKNIVLLITNLNEINMIFENLNSNNNIYKLDLIEFNKHYDLIQTTMNNSIDYYINVSCEICLINFSNFKNYDKEALSRYISNARNLQINIRDSVIYTDNYIKFLRKSLDNTNILLEAPIYLPDMTKINQLVVPEKPILEPINFSDLYLEGLKCTGINLGYLFFYPIFYCSNKIFGTSNPLSSHLFVDALWYFITFKMFF